MRKWRKDNAAAKAQRHAYDIANREAISAQNQAWMDANPLKTRRNTRRRVAAWRKRNPEKYKAHVAVRDALKTGKLVKEPCEHANEHCKGRVHAHHDDYSKPLEVHWLCAFHHRAEHAPKTERPGGTGRSGTA